MNAAPRIALVLVVASTLAACAHTGTLATPSSNTIILGKSGIPEFLREPNRCPMQNGEGAMKKTWDNGETMFQGACKGGVMVGAWTAFYENGAKEWQATFDGGRVAGEFRSFYANDAKRAKVAFKDGVPDGDYVGWHINGEVAAKGRYLGGKKNGCWETWHDNKQQASKGTYADDTPVLTWLYWTADGSRRKDKLGGEALHGQCLITL